MEKRKSETAKKIMGKKPTYVSLLLISLLPTIASLLQTGQITMAVNVAQKLASCILIIKMVIDKK